MQAKELIKQHTIQVSDQFGNTQPCGTYEVAFRRWLVGELNAGRISPARAIEQFNLNPKSGYSLLGGWRKKYSPDIYLNLPVMTDKERQRLEALQKQVKQLEKLLEHARMKTIALETLIDVAEEDFKIPIRKKGGAKQ